MWWSCDGRAGSPSAAARPSDNGHGCGSCWWRSKFVAFGSSFASVDEDEPLGLEVKLAFELLLTPLQDVGAVLLDRVAGFFFTRDAVTIEEPPDRDPDRVPRSASLPWISQSVVSPCSSTSARTKPA
jgi:hypothetical protein